MNIIRSRMLVGLIVWPGLLALIQVPSLVIASNTANLDEISSAQLIILFDPTHPESPTPDEVISAVNSDNSEKLRTALEDPIEARLLLGGKSPPEFLAELANDPLSARSLLEQYVVLTYEDSNAAITALSDLSSDDRLLSVQPNLQYAFSAVPVDTYYAYNPISTGYYQWAMPALNMPAAWDMTWGHAYIGDIDSGVPCVRSSIFPYLCTGTSHPDLKQNFRHQFSSVALMANVPPQGYDEYPPEYYRGHGTHTAGIIAATPEFGPFSNFQTNTGVAGICWTCSLAALKTDLFSATVAVALTYIGDYGFQVANMSFGDYYGTRYGGEPRIESCDNPGTVYHAECLALEHASVRDAGLVGASGNGAEPRVQFPARDRHVIAVGGMQFGDEFWHNGYGNNCSEPNQQYYDECGSNWGPEQHLVAPAMDIVSTFPIGGLWNPNIKCGDGFPLGGDPTDGYGDCTGTSMSAPFVTGIVGLLRSVDPLLMMDEINTALVTHARPCTGFDGKCGNGIPDTAASVQAVLGDPEALNRLTPLFSFYSNLGEDHFYTSVPQMAMAAMEPSHLLPQPEREFPTVGDIAFGRIGSPVDGYLLFPNQNGCSFSPPCPAPLAVASIFTTHINPYGGQLVPLYRYSYACKLNNDPFCQNLQGYNPPKHISHVYLTDFDGENAGWLGADYLLDGIEGYIYSPVESQPPGTVRLCRKYDSNRDDYVLFLGTGKNGNDCSATNDGTSAGGFYEDPDPLPNWIGWVYTVRMPQPVCSDMQPCGVPGVPDLKIVKSHAASFTLGQSGAVYSLVVSNVGAGASSGTVSVTDTVPAGLTATAMSGTGWSCTLATKTCTRSSALAPNTSFPSISVTVNVASNATPVVVNTASVTGGGDSSPANNTSSDSTLIRSGYSPDLALWTGPQPAQGPLGARAHVTNVGTGTFTGVSVKVKLYTFGAGTTFVAPSICTSDERGGPPGSYEEFTCRMGRLTPGQTKDLEFFGSGGGGWGGGSIDIELVTPTHPIDVNTQNDSDVADATFWDFG